MTHLTKQIPDVNRRRKIPAWAIRWVVTEITEQFAPRKIVLFGSYAWGTPRPESDVDLLVVMRTRREGEQSLLIRQAIACPFGIDLIVRTPQSLARRLKLGDSFLRQIMDEGKVLYEADDR